MRLFFDTSVIVASLIAQHADHSRCFNLLERILSGKDEGFISAHSLAEIYAILTKLPAGFRHSPSEALLSIQENILSHFNVIGLSPAEYAALLKDAATRGIHGGTIYDALLLKCASKEKFGRIYTLNMKHFQTAASQELFPLITSP